MDWPEKIRECFVSGAVLYTRHARIEMKEEQFGPIADQEVYEAMCACEVIEEYAEDTPYPSVLALGRTQAGRPIHAVCAYALEDEMIIVVTVYEPDPNRWEDYRRRKS